MTRPMNRRVDVNDARFGYNVGMKIAVFGSDSRAVAIGRLVKSAEAAAEISTPGVPKATLSI